MNHFSFGSGGKSATSLAGRLELWLHANRGITLNGGDVSSWADQSGKGDANRDVTQGTAGRQPLYNSTDGSYNGRATISFTAANLDALVSGTWATALEQPFTFFFVGEIGNGSNQVLWERLTNNPNRAGFIWWWGLSAGEIYASIDPDIYKRATIAAPDWPAFPSIFAAVYDGPRATLYTNKKTALTAVDGANGGVGPANISGVRIGIAFDDASHPLNGKIAQVRLYRGAFSEGERSTVFNELSAEYAISIGA